MDKELTRTGQVYKNLEKLDLNIIRIGEPVLAEFSSVFFELRIEYESFAGHPLVEQLFRRIRWFVFVVRTHPIPYVSWNIWSEGLLKLIVDADNESIHDFSALRSSAEKVSSFESHPFLNAIKESADASDSRKIGIVVSKRNLCEASHNHIKDLPIDGNVSVLTQTDLKKGSTYDHLLICGKPEMYPFHIYRSPKSSTVEYLTFGFDRLDLTEIRPFAEKIHSRAGELPRLDVVNIGKPTAKDGYELNFSELDPEMNWERLKNREKEYHVDGPDEEIEARPVLIGDGESLIYVPDSGNERLNILEWNGENDFEFRENIHVDELESGMWLLLRTAGSDELYFELSRSKFGEGYERCRKMMSEWKSSLNDLHKRMGINHLIKHLQRHGAKSASKNNVMNWLKDDTIRPRNNSDFRALLEISNIVYGFEEMENAAELIYKAHKSAGFEISRLLKQKAREITGSMHENVSDGQSPNEEFDIPLGLDDDTKFTAYPVGRVFNQSFPVSRSRCYRMLERDEL